MNYNNSNFNNYNLWNYKLENRLEFKKNSILILNKNTKIFIFKTNHFLFKSDIIPRLTFYTTFKILKIEFL